jgi:sortase (surface protein transpeptidase)
VVTTEPGRNGWRAFWDPESEVLILTLASAIMAGLGIAMIMMGALPEAPPALSSAEVAEAAEPVPAPPPSTMPSNSAHKTTSRANSKAKGRTLSRSVPVSLKIPAIGVDTPLMSLGLNPDRTIALPPVKGDAPAGWYKYLATPGEPGPAVILGHVDSAKDGPAVFYRLRELRPGDQISVTRTDGSIARFTVRSLAQYAKNHFPTDAVYGPVPDAELRLVTCGGSFDPVRRHYRDNIVVYAALTGSSPPRKAAGEQPPAPLIG